MNAIKLILKLIISIVIIIGYPICIPIMYGISNDTFKEVFQFYIDILRDLWDGSGRLHGW